MAIFVFVLAINSCENKEVIVPMVVVPSDCDTTGMTYSSGTDTIRTIINTQCAVTGCHNTYSVNGDFTTYNGVSKAAQGGSSSQMYINLQGGATPMPQSQQPGWSECDKQKIEAWILQGANQ
ncbi:MAG: hypothetical protein ACLQQ4_10490 [Bacteroidia bacterium]